MDATKTCRSCRALKSLSDFRIGRQGKPVATCRACQNSRARELIEADPQRAAARRERNRLAAAAAYAAKAPGRAEATGARRAARAAAMDGPTRERAEALTVARKSAAAKAAARAATAEVLAAEAIAVQRRMEASGILDGKSRSEREAELKDAMWDAMRASRERRAPYAVTSTPGRPAGIKLKGGGYIGIGEFALRCAEREACAHACASRALLPAACEVIALLEQGTTGSVRRYAMSLFARTSQSGGRQAVETESATPEVAEGDPFAECLSDWAPARHEADTPSWRLAA